MSKSDIKFSGSYRVKNFLGVSLLCAASAAFAQSEIPGELFAKLAGDWYATDQCAIEGRIKLETAEYGKQLLRQSLYKYEADMTAFMRLVEALRQKMKNGLPDAKLCTTIAVEIEEIRLQVVAAETKAQSGAKQQLLDAQVKNELKQQQERKEETPARAYFSVIEIATFIIENSLSDDTNDTAQLGQKICAAGGRPSYDCPSYITLGSGICLSQGRPSYDCPSTTTIGQGICMAGGRPSYDCLSYTKIGQGICLSTGRPSYDCLSYVTLAQGLCLAKGQPSYNCSSVSLSTAMQMEIIDIDWAWDRFYDEYKNVQWRCRGRSTGQFSEDVKCSDKTKVDDTWPSMRL